MQARVSRSRVSPAEVDRTAEELRTRVLPPLARSPGLVSAAWIVDLDREEVLGIVLWTRDRSGPPIEGEPWEVVACAGRLGGAWCTVHTLEGDALPSVLQTAFDRARASAGNRCAVALHDPRERRGLLLSFSDARPPAGEAGQVYRVLGAV